MKKTIIALFVMLALAITAAHAGSRMFKIAQAEAPQAEASPVMEPETAPEAAPVTESEPAVEPAPAETTEPVAEPAPAETAPATEAAPTAEPATAPMAEPAPTKAPEPKPAVAKEPRQEARPMASARATGKQDHRGFAEMETRECAECHIGQGIAPNHGADWVRGHRLPASKPNKNCKECHVQSFCLDCHKGGGIDVNLNTEIVRGGTAPESHRTDFLEIHPLKARDNLQTCNRCHNVRFCSECHEKFRGEDLRIQSHRRAWSDSRPSALSGLHGTFPADSCKDCHPNGLLPKHEWSSDHAREARRNLQACQTCHSDGETCLKCHSARTGLRINPHPRGWNTVKEGYKKRSDGRSCTRCHDKY